MENNLSATLNPLTLEEEELIQALGEKFFKFLVSTQWENVEVAKYWKKMSDGGWDQKSDI